MQHRKLFFMVTSPGQHSLRMLALLLVIAVFGAGYALAQEVTDSYVIGSQDVLEIKVWGHDDLSRSVIISADGNFSFPLIGSIRAAGLTVLQLEQQIAKLLDKDYIVNPQVNVTVTEYKSKKVFILGEVVRPGSYYLSKSDTLLEIISKAGGVSTDAGREVMIVRPFDEESAQQPAELDSQNSEIIRVDIQALLSGDVSKNIEVQNNDTIYVAKRSMYSVFGEVRSPGSYPLDTEITILEAVSIAGGLNETADPQKLELLRRQGDEQEKIIINIKELLEGRDDAEKFLIQDGDVIYQPRAELFFVLGEVTNPGTYKLEDGMTVSRAISLAGGYTERAAKSRVQILRNNEEGKQVKHRTEPNELVQSEDIIEVPQSFF